MILPDADLLVAFTWVNHPQNVAAENFFRKNPEVATCPLTELALVRVWMQKGASGADADKALKDFVSKLLLLENLALRHQLTVLRRRNREQTLPC